MLEAAEGRLPGAGPARAAPLRLGDEAPDGAVDLDVLVPLRQWRGGGAVDLYVVVGGEIRLALGLRRALRLGGRLDPAPEALYAPAQAPRIAPRGPLGLRGIGLRRLRRGRLVRVLGESGIVVREAARELRLAKGLVDNLLRALSRAALRGQPGVKVRVLREDALEAQLGIYVVFLCQLLSVQQGR